MRPQVATAACLVAVLSCGQPTAGPSQTVRAFVQAMDRSERNPGALEEAYRLLDPAARGALAQRASRASALSGRKYEPWEMLARGRFRLRFASAAVGGLRERIEGDRAVVIVRGKSAGQRAEIPLLREQGQWRIQLALPALHGEGSPGEGS